MKIDFNIQQPADVLAMVNCPYTAAKNATWTLKAYLKELYELAYGSYDGLELDETGFGYS